MHSPLARVIVALLGGYIIILVLISSYRWISEEFPQRPAQTQKIERIQHTFYHKEALDALHFYHQLPKSERTAVFKKLKENLVPLGSWLERINNESIMIICLGELHEENTRNFLAEYLFSKLRIDVLLLEATPAQLKRLLELIKEGRDYYPLLDADILNILYIAKQQNPDIKIWGIEETDDQQSKETGPQNTRDQFIARNFWNKFESGKRHVILFGALHCANESNWLFKNLTNRAPHSLQKSMTNMRVLGEHQNGPLEAFTYFLDEIGIAKRHFAIPDTRTLPSCIYTLFPELNRQTLTKYRVLIVFRS